MHTRGERQLDQAMSAGSPKMDTVNRLLDQGVGVAESEDPDNDMEQAPVDNNVSMNQAY